MFPINVVFTGLFLASVFLSGLFSIFLFWRWGRKELIESELLFDTALVGFLGSLVSGRIFAFLLNPAQFGFNLYKLLFFNVYPGFSFWGAIFGLVTAMLVLLRRKNENIWKLLDLASGPLAFFFSIFNLAAYLAGKSQKIFLTASGLRFDLDASVIYFIYFMILFWILSRLGKQKKPDGFFAGTFSVLGGLAGVAVEFALGKNETTGVGLGVIAPFLLIILGGYFWYVKSGRDAKGDVKTFSAFFLLVVFGVKRIMTSLEEAGKVSKSILFSPYFLIRSVYFGLLKLGQEVLESFIDLAKAVRGKA